MNAWPEVPKVGDWVKIKDDPEDGTYLIRSLHQYPPQPKLGSDVPIITQCELSGIGGRGVLPYRPALTELLVAKPGKN